MHNFRRYTIVAIVVLTIAACTPAMHKSPTADVGHRIANAYGLGSFDQI